MKCTGQPLDKATKVYDKLYDEKVGKGYKEGAISGGVYTPAPVAVISSSGERFVPQLLNPIEESELDKYLHDDSYGMQEKKDGKHVIGCYRDALLTVYNKKGRPVGYPAGYRDALSVPCVIDGETIGDVLHVFDLLEVLGVDYRGRGYGDRYAKLSTMEFGSSIRIVPLAIGYTAKKKLYDQMVINKKEGVVFKRLSSLYTPGRPSSLGDMLKLKFYATCSVRVSGGRTGKHSVSLEILDGGAWVGVGNVTIAPSIPLPSVNKVVEVRYLYAYPGGSLYQPTYIGPRDDVDDEECVISQLKYKSSEDD
jgi:bifunctional non-homologous end joining protein LigD